jgi:hypothetical protein
MYCMWKVKYLRVPDEYPEVCGDSERMNRNRISERNMRCKQSIREQNAIIRDDGRHDYRMQKEWIVDPYEYKSVNMEKEEIDYP